MVWIKNDYERKTKYDLLAVIRKKAQNQNCNEKEQKNDQFQNLENKIKTRRNFSYNLKRYSIPKVSE